MKVESAKMDAFLNETRLARLATADADGQPHVVPVWYLWDGESLWISTFQSTHKVRVLRQNPRCAVVVDDEREGLELRGVMMQGAAELVHAPREFVVDMSTRIYTRYLGEQGVLAAEPQSWIHDDENALIRLKPERVVPWK